jgi:hypothetical protein
VRHRATPDSAPGRESGSQRDHRAGGAVAVELAQNSRAGFVQEMLLGVCLHRRE